MPTARTNSPTSTNRPTRSSAQVCCMRCAMKSSCSLVRSLTQPCAHIDPGPRARALHNIYPTNSPSPAFPLSQPIKFPRETTANTRPSTRPSPPVYPQNRLVPLDKPQIWLPARCFPLLWERCFLSLQGALRACSRHQTESSPAQIHPVLPAWPTWLLRRTRRPSANSASSSLPPPPAQPPPYPTPPTSPP